MCLFFVGGSGGIMGCFQIQVCVAVCVINKRCVFCILNSIGSDSSTLCLVLALSYMLQWCCSLSLQCCDPAWFDGVFTLACRAALDVCCVCYHKCCLVLGGWLDSVLSSSFCALLNYWVWQDSFPPDNNHLFYTELLTCMKNLVSPCNDQCLSSCLGVKPSVYEVNHAKNTNVLMLTFSLIFQRLHYNNYHLALHFCIILWPWPNLKVTRLSASTAVPCLFIYIFITLWSAVW